MRWYCEILLLVSVLAMGEEPAAPDASSAESALIQRGLERLRSAKSVRVEARANVTADLRGVQAKSELSISLVAELGENGTRRSRIEVHVADRDPSRSEHWILLPGMEYSADAAGKRVRCFSTLAQPDLFSSLLMMLPMPFDMGIPFFAFKKRALPEKVLDGVACAGFAGEAQRYTAYYGKEDGILRRIDCQTERVSCHLQVTRVEFDAPIDPALFTLQPPPGTEIYKEVKPLPEPKRKGPTPRKTAKFERVPTLDSPFPEEKKRAPYPEFVVRGEDF